MKVDRLKDLQQRYNHDKLLLTTLGGVLVHRVIFSSIIDGEMKTNAFRIKTVKYETGSTG